MGRPSRQVARPRLPSRPRPTSCRPMGAMLPLVSSASECHAGGNRDLPVLEPGDAPHRGPLFRLLPPGSRRSSRSLPAHFRRSPASSRCWSPMGASSLCTMVSHAHRCHPPCTARDQDQDKAQQGPGVTDGQLNRTFHSASQ